MYYAWKYVVKEPSLELKVGPFVQYNGWGVYSIAGPSIVPIYIYYIIYAAGNKSGTIAATGITLRTATPYVPRDFTSTAIAGSLH